jgi:hypothetical protein
MQVVNIASLLLELTLQKGDLILVSTLFVNMFGDLELQQPDLGFLLLPYFIHCLNSFILLFKIVFEMLNLCCKMLLSLL